MRFINWLLHLLIVSLMFWVAQAEGQTQGFAPQLIDSVESCTNSQSCDIHGTLVWPENIAVNDTIAVCSNSDTNGPYTISDTLGNAWTCTSPTQTPAPQPTALSYMCYTKSGFAGADTISFTAANSFNFTAGMRFKNLGTVDGSVATGTQNAGNSLTTLSTTQTTTVNGDTLVSCGVGSPFNFPEQGPGSSNQAPTAHPSVNQTVMETFVSTGAFGSYTSSHNVYSATGFGSQGTYAMQTIGFKPSTILLGDSAMPYASAGVSYSAQLHGYGGTAALSYACTGLPSNGLSLNTSTGVISGANPTLGTVTAGCTVTDGTVTSATDNLTINIFGGFNNPAVINTFQFNADGGGGVIGTFAGIQCGDTIVVFARGDDTHGGEGWVQMASGANNKITDSLNSPIRRYDGPIPGTRAFPVVAYIIGPIITGGSDTITLVNNQGASSALEISFAIQLRGVQSVVDFGADANSLTTASSGTISASLTTVVTNTLILAAAMSDRNVTTVSLGAPFTVLFSDGVSETFGYYLSPTATSTTAALAYTGGAVGQRWASLMLPLRSGLPGSSCPTFVGLGEKIKRYVGW